MNQIQTALVVAARAGIVALRMASS
ncbi:MAG: photosystem I reaction center subunit XII [Kofleriaceae bacterium]|nr:photosystem I reaction center subunit XII [Kofleriaceae bacterium]